MVFGPRFPTINAALCTTLGLALRALTPSLNGRRAMRGSSGFELPFQLFEQSLLNRCTPPAAPTTGGVKAVERAP